MRIYLVSHYDEDGADDVRATADRSKVEGIVRTYWPDNREDEVNKVREVIDTLGKHNLSHGWGGIQLHVVELE